MSSSVPLGRKEDQGLEFKDRRALADLPSIAREVVAMLNSTYAGEVWIGVAERDDYAVELQDIPDAVRELRRVQDSLVDLIEPRPGRQELFVDAVPFDSTSPSSGGTLLVVRTEPNPPHRPYALVRKEGRKYVTRVQDRIRPMTREELQLAFQQGVEPLGSERSALDDARERIIEARSRTNDAMLLHVIPLQDQRLELSREQREILADPERCGGRAGGWNYGNSFSRFVPDRDKAWRLDFETPRGVLRTRIGVDGTLEFRAPTQWLTYDREREIHPYALLEGPTSVLRMYRSLLESDPRRSPCRCLVGLALSGVRDWKLRPFSPRAPGFQFEHPGHEHHVFGEADEIVVGPDLLEWEDFTSGDDRVALRLIRGVYRWFGYEDDAIPKEFDQDKRRLTIA